MNNVPVYSHMFAEVCKLLVAIKQIDIKNKSIRVILIQRATQLDFSLLDLRVRLVQQRGEEIL